MPCYVTGTREGDLALSADEARAEATKLAQLLCKACDALEWQLRMPDEVNAWWRAHKAVDANRRAVEEREKDKRRALYEAMKSERERLLRERKTFEELEKEFGYAESPDPIFDR